MADLNELNEKVEQIKADIREQLEKIENTKGVYEYKKTILDKNGIIGGLMKQMGSGSYFHGLPGGWCQCYGCKPGNLRLAG